jgi:hypothetical protein
VAGTSESKAAQGAAPASANGRCGVVVLSGELDPDGAMALLHDYEVIKQQLN